MKEKTIVAAAALLALAGCDRLGFGQGAKPDDNQSAAANASNAGADAGDKPAGNSAAPADAGVTTSRSLAGLMGGGESAGAGGGKDPTAIPASSGAGIDPVLVPGRWSDNPDCKSIVTLNGDGSFEADGGAQGEWRLAGNVLTLSVGGQDAVFRIQSLDANYMSVINADGSPGRSRRC